MTIAGKLQSTLEEHFRWFHSHPELSLEERATTAHIKEILSGFGVELLELGLETGALARAGGSPGPVIALRCDIDALPISEKSGLPYSSLNEGRMHACGHDFHTTALIGAAMLLHEKRDQLAGTVKLLFQPAEEGTFGAEKVLATGSLDDMREIYGLHVAAELEPGAVAVCVGADHAAVDMFSVHVKGSGGHAAAPHKCADPIVALAQFINAAQGVVARNVDPFDNAVLSVTHIHSGSTWNVIPDEAFAEGTIRTLAAKTRERVAKRLSELGEGVARSSGTEFVVNLENRCPPTDNAPELVDIVARTAKELGMPVVPIIPDMGGEDFALYQKRVPGVFFSVGVGSPRPLHNAGFVADPAPLAGAATLMATLAEKSLLRLSASI
ncbi:MAG: amidohydrolase [Synergistaceae bacterium]|nr:amidohydrolase [Synergistaceae bacterium]